MQTSPEVVFQGMTASAQVQDAIEKHIAELEQRWGRITACRVVVKGPGQRHHKGGVYDVHIRLALPDGREVNVERTPRADERYADLTFALDHAFKRARRQLQDRCAIHKTKSSITKACPLQRSWGLIRPASSVSSRRAMDRKSTSTATACSMAPFPA